MTSIDYHDLSHQSEQNFTMRHGYATNLFAEQCKMNIHITF